MKEVKLYTCEHCNAQYADKAEARRCEKGHISCKEISWEKYLPIGVDNSGYPQQIDVIMSNGKKVRYKRLKET